MSPHLFPFSWTFYSRFGDLGRRMDTGVTVKKKKEKENLEFTKPDLKTLNVGSHVWLFPHLIQCQGVQHFDL